MALGLAVVHGGAGAEISVQQGRHLPLYGHQGLVVLKEEGEFKVFVMSK